MIVKNEAGGLRKAIESARPLVNEIIIGVDSKSTDDTFKIAKELGKAYKFDWTDDFSKARNEGLDKSTGDWNLILDGHEYITQYPEMDLLEIEDGVDSMRAEMTMENGEVVSTERILRKDVRYKNKVHNEPMTKKSLPLPDLKMVHDRTQQPLEVIKARNKQRIEMNEEDMTGDTFRSHWYLGQLYRGSEIKKSIKHYKRAIELQKKGNKAIAQCAQYFLAQMLYEDGKVKQALNAVGDELMEFQYVRGMIHFREGEFSEAVKCFLEALVTEKMTVSSRPVKDIEFEIYDVLSQCLYELKQYKLARAAAFRALEYKEDKRVEQNADAFTASTLAIEEKGREYYDKIFKDGYDTSRYEDVYKVILRILEEIDDPRVLEIGCGVGTLGKMIIDKGYKYRGFDFSKEAIKQCKKLGARGHFYLGNAYDKKEYKGNYNVVIATEVLEHVDDLKVLSLIKSGVMFIGSVPNFGDEAHLRVYKNKQEDIVDRFSKYLSVEKTLFSEQTGIYIVKGTLK